MSDRRAHRWWQTGKKANPQNYSEPLSRLLCSRIFSFLPHAVWLEACLECLAQGLLITSAAASIRSSPWLQGCCRVGWTCQSYPSSPGAFTAATHRSISCRCTRTECAVKQVFYTSRVRSLSPSCLPFLRQNEVSLGGVWSRDQGVLNILYIYIKKSECIPVRECDLSINTFQCEVYL